MNSSVNKTTGKCHCGNLEVIFKSSIPTNQLVPRICTCSFCSKHGALSISDPNGNIEINIKEPDNLIKYKFGLNITEFFICKKCGGYLCAVMNLDGQTYAVLNANNLEVNGELQKGTKISYEEENEEDRINRRKTKWTPAKINC